MMKLCSSSDDRVQPEKFGTNQRPPSPQIRLTETATLYEDNYIHRWPVCVCVCVCVWMKNIFDPDLNRLSASWHGTNATCNSGVALHNIPPE